MIDVEALQVLKWGVMCETENDSETKTPPKTNMKKQI